MSAGGQLNAVSGATGFGLVSSHGPASTDSPPGIVLLDALGQILGADPSAEYLFGCSTQQLSGRAFESLLDLPPGTRLPWAEEDSHAALGSAPDATTGAAATPEGPCWRAGCQARRADGALFPIDAAISRVVVAGLQGAGVYFTAWVQDLSQQRAFEAELQTAQRRLHMLIELAPIAIWVAEGERVTLANRAAGELMGFDSGAALVGKSVFGLLDPAQHDELRRHLAQAVSHEGQIGQLQARLVGPNSNAPEVEIALAALPDHGMTTVQMVVSNVSQRNRELREMQRSRHLLKRLSTNVIEAREEERRRISRELHDELSQALSAMKMDVSLCASSHAMPENDDRVAGLLKSLDSIMTSVRRIASDLRPPMLDDLGLNDAIEALANDFSRRLGIRVQLHLDPLVPPPDEKAAIAVYRMVQEALTNVARHSYAALVRIDLRRTDSSLTLSVRDDGVGLATPGPPHRDNQFGLLGMQERADALGGRLHIENLLDGGACLVVQLPLAPPATTPKGVTSAAQRHTGP